MWKILRLIETETDFAFRSNKNETFFMLNNKIFDINYNVMKPPAVVPWGELSLFQ